MTTDATEPLDDLARVRTGNAELDRVLGGGFPAASINVIMGEPGSGKTILAEQLMFANAAVGGRPVVYLTTLSEPLDKVVRYLQRFEFFDAELLARGAVIYESLGADLAERGIAAVAPRLRDLIKNVGPCVIVIDSFKAIHDLSTSAAEIRRMLVDVAGLLTAYDTTVLLIGEYDEDVTSTLPEFAIADGIVSLTRRRPGTHDERYLRVLKLRGSGYLQGLHAVRVSARGLEVFPRLTSPDTPPSYQAATARMSIGVPGIDRMLAGGLWAGSTTLVQGPTGSGKTTLALQFVADGIRRGEPAIYVNFQENPTQLARSIDALGMSYDRLRADGLQLLYASPVELQIDMILVDLFRMADDGRVRRVVLDSVGELLHNASDVERLFAYLYALGQHFVVRGISTMMTLERTQGRDLERLSALSDAIVALDTTSDGGPPRRTVQVIKARGIHHTLDARTLEITEHGIEVP